MMLALLVIFSVFLLDVSAGSSINNEGDGPGLPLFLTPLIEAGRLREARNAARVPSMIEGKRLVSYSGFLTVNSTYNSNLFFWFFPAETRPKHAPVALWLQGGPGGSSLYGLLAENGPLIITPSLNLRKRKFQWSRTINMIYIDNPVGTGFSFTDSDDGYATNQNEVGRDLYEALVQFFRLFPYYRQNEFFITGESYAGKYIPALGYTIHTNNPTAEVKINLAGLAIGDGWVDPLHMMVYSQYLNQLGLINDKTSALMKIKEDKVVDLINNKQYRAANDEWNAVLGQFSTEAGPIDIYDYLIASTSSPVDSLINKFFAKSTVRQQIHVGNFTYNDGSKVYSKLYGDMLKSVAPWLELLMEHYRVMLYNGQLDIIVAYPLTTNFVKQLSWSGAAEYLEAPRKQWYVGKQLAGYTISVNNFTQVLVRNAGHMVPSQQPKWSFNLINHFAHGIPLNNKPSSSNNISEEDRTIKLF